MTAEADYAWWRSALAGSIGPIHDGAPQCGYYRKKTKAGSPQPVAIFRNEMGVIVALVGHENREVTADEIWTWVATNPVSYESYEAFINDGKWPDDIAAASNNAPDGEANQDEIDNAIAAALAELAKPAFDQAHADRLAAHRERLGGLYRAQEAKRKAEKQAHDDAAKAVQAKYLPVLNRIEAAGVKVKAALTEYLVKAQEVAPETKAKAGGITARTTALRTIKTAVVTDYAAALAYFANHYETVELVNKLANRAVKSGTSVPGVEEKTERVAA